MEIVLTIVVGFVLGGLFIELTDRIQEKIDNKYNYEVEDEI